MKMDYLNNTKRLRLLMVFGAALLFMKNVFKVLMQKVIAGR